MKSKFIKVIFIILAFIFLALGIIGVIIPVMPTTPFLLAASFFFAKGSDRFNKWFISTRIYKNYLEDFLKSRAMTKKGKNKILIPVSIMLAISFFSIANIYVKAIIVFLFFFKEYYFRYHIRTIKETKDEAVIETTD